MTRFVALLRGINVGGHTVKMKDLQKHFEALAFTNVETVIASGNVIFEAPGDGGRALEQMIEDHLERTLGYAVATFVRTIPEMAAVVAKQPYTLAEQAPEAAVYAIFVRDQLKADVRRAMDALTTDNDEAKEGKRVVYWLRRARCKEAEIFGAQLTKLLGNVTTSRNMNTVRAIASR